RRPGAQAWPAGSRWLRSCTAPASPPTAGAARSAGMGRPLAGAGVADAAEPEEERPMATTQHYDAIVIGAGQAGGPLSTALARAGRKTAIVEREHVGGACINEGCSPSTAMHVTGRAACLHGSSALGGCIHC